MGVGKHSENDPLYAAFPENHCFQVPEETTSGADLQGGDADARRHAARMMGHARTEQKAAAACENGKKGGRPKGIPATEETKQKIRAAKRANLKSK